MALIEDVESGKKNIRDYLENARSNPEGRAYELIEFLEDGDVLSERFPNKIGRASCRERVCDLV